ncbi:MAG TPA: rhodanese-like domain-containing protein [Bryobacteraceae bacterium]|nr:rhodanese-like domain-containing protein [Bryobacteraceae bacterium]
MTPVEIEPLDVKARLDAGEKLFLLDVREPFEHQQAHIPGARLVPMRSVPGAVHDLLGLTEPLIVFCHHGVRSLQVVEWLRRQGLENCASMAGGIDRWSLKIDPTVPRYY